MKNRIIVFTTTLWLSLTILNLPAATANSTASDAALHKALRDVPPPEMPAKAGQLVRDSKADDQIKQAIAVLHAARAVNPSALVAVVGAIARAVPATAPAIAAEIAMVSPDQVRSVARAAAASAPAYADQIVAQACIAAPDKFSEVAVEVARVVPQATHSILFALGEALPNLRPYLENAKSLTAAGRSTPPSVGLVMIQARELLEKSGTGASSLGGQGASGDVQPDRKKKSVDATKKKSSKKKTKKKSKKKSTKKKTKSKDYSKP